MRYNSGMSNRVKTGRTTPREASFQDIIDLLSLVPSLDIRIVQETPDDVGQWRAWTVESGGRTCRVERPVVESDRCDVLEYTWNKKPVREVEYHHDVDAPVPYHHWGVNSGGLGAGTFRSLASIGVAIRTVLTTERSS